MNAAPKARPFRFQATIYRIWMMRHVDVPEEICRVLQKQAGTKRHIPVVAIVNGCRVRTTIVPAGGGRYRITLNATLRKAARVDVGDLVGVELRVDRDSREIPLPPELRGVLKDHPSAWRAYQALPPGHRRQLLLFYTRAKSPHAKERAARFAVDHLIARALLQPKRARRSKSARK